jgi:uncharacterized protein (UPF0147 family)
MTPKQAEQFNRMRAVLRTIATNYMTIAQIRRNAGAVGMSFDECLQAAYENVKTEAANAVRGVSEIRPNPKADVAPASGAHVQRVIGCELLNGEKK